MRHFSNRFLDSRLRGNDGMGFELSMESRNFDLVKKLQRADM